MRHLTILTMCFLSLIFVLTSCEKQELVGDPGTPVFMAEVPFVNEETFEVVAGDELYYMFASYQNIEDAEVFGGLFGKEDICEEGCAENFAIKIVQKSSSVDEPLTTGKYDFYSIPKDGFKHNFSTYSSEEDDLSSISWRLGNEVQTGQNNFSFNSSNGNTIQEGIQMLYDVPEQFIARFERSILPKTVDCKLSLNISRVANEGLYLELVTESPFTFVNWSNGTVGSKLLVNSNIQTYSANVFDATGCQTKVIVNLNAQNISKDYVIGFDQESFMFSTPDNASRSVIIEYTDKDGAFYTSSVLGQILPFEFNINSIEDYEVNELGQPTAKIDSNFDCILFGENGASKRIDGGKAIFAVAY